MSIHRPILDPAEAVVCINRSAAADNLRACAISERFEKATSLVKMLADTNPPEAAAICAAYLDQYGAGDPVHSAFGDIRDSAEFWADCANPAELEAYFSASLKRLPRTVLCIAARKRCLVALWGSLTDQDRAAFLARVDPQGQFTGRAVQ